MIFSIYNPILWSLQSIDPILGPERGRTSLLASPPHIRLGVSMMQEIVLLKSIFSSIEYDAGDV